jgi:hypothetical protein
MNHDPLIDQIVDELRTKYGCHTVILYGSRAHGDQRPNSDYDLLGIRAGGGRLRDARRWNGAYLDLLIYPEHLVARPDETMLQWLGGVVLHQKDHLGDTLLARLDVIFRAGPAPLPEDERETRRVWVGKMLDRAREGGIEANYHRVWLLTSLLEDYFQLRDQWYLGPKKSFLWLKEHDLATYTAFDLALQPTATFEQIAMLIARVITV